MFYISCRFKNRYRGDEVLMLHFLHWDISWNHISTKCVPDKKPKSQVYILYSCHFLILCQCRILSNQKERVIMSHIALPTGKLSHYTGWDVSLDFATNKRGHHYCCYLCFDLLKSKHWSLPKTMSSLEISFNIELTFNRKSYATCAELKS